VHPRLDIVRLCDVVIRISLTCILTVVELDPKGSQVLVSELVAQCKDVLGSLSLDCRFPDVVSERYGSTEEGVELGFKLRGLGSSHVPNHTYITRPGSLGLYSSPPNLALRNGPFSQSKHSQHFANPKSYSDEGLHVVVFAPSTIAQVDVDRSD
jgi:hypothetical protein